MVVPGAGKPNPLSGRYRGGDDRSPKARNSLIAIGLVVLVFAVLIVWATLN